jgi:hypothetical protein
MDKPFSPGTKSKWGYEIDGGYEKGKSIHETNKIKNGKNNNIKTVT